MWNCIRLYEYGHEGSLWWKPVNKFLECEKGKKRECSLFCSSSISLMIQKDVPKNCLRFSKDQIQTHSWDWIDNNSVAEVIEIDFELVT